MAENDNETPPGSAMPQFWGEKKPGVNLDPIDVAAGMRRLEMLGWSPTQDARTFMLIEYCLQRWARGEEAQAERQAIAQGETDPQFIAAAIDLTSWRMVLASAMTAGAAALAAKKSQAATETSPIDTVQQTPDETVNEDPPGIDPHTSDLPTAGDAAERVAAFLRWYGDGRVVVDTEESGPPLYARDLEVLTRSVSPS